MAKQVVRAGMGAIVHDGGVAFRVWAPNADAVFVTGSFNDWAEDAAPMREEEPGIWYLDVAGAKAGDEYRFVIRNGAEALSRIDPYARAVTSSVGNGVVVASVGPQGDFATPPWNRLVIYEMHIGTFARTEDEGGTFDGAIDRLRPPQAPGGERDPDHALGRVRRGHLLGLQSGAHLRGREHLRRPGRPARLRRGRACRRDRGDPRRGLQPLRPLRPRPVALRRLVRERRRRHLLLQRLEGRDALGRDPARLRPRRGAAVHPRQRALLARGVRPRRPALRHDALHPHREGRRGRPRRRARGGLEPAALDQRGGGRALSRLHHHRRGSAQQGRGHRGRRGRRRPASARSGTPSSCTRSARR